MTCSLGASWDFLLQLFHTPFPIPLTLLPDAVPVGVLKASECPGASPAAGEWVSAAAGVWTSSRSRTARTIRFLMGLSGPANSRQHTGIGASSSG